MKSSKMFKSIASFALVAAMVAPTLVTTPVSVDAAKKMSLSAKSALLPTGTTKVVSVKKATKGSKYSWKSSNKKVATVKGKKKKATITAVSAGKSKISCTVKKGKKKTVVSGLTVKVRQTVKAFAMQDTSNKAVSQTTIKVGETTILKGAINNNAAGSTTNQTVKWASSDSKIVKVSKKSVNTAKVKGIKEGTATITATVAYKSKTDKKVATCKVKVSGTAAANTSNANQNNSKTEAKAEPTPWVYEKGTLYKQHFNVTRWYDPDPTGKINGHKHDGYKNNNFAIWMIGFYDNEYSTNEDAYNHFGGPAIDNWTDASVKDAKAQDFRGTALNLTGEFSYEGTNQNTVLLQVNYTSPTDYPILWKWEKNASKTGTGYEKELACSGKNGSENLEAGKVGKVNVTFTVPKNAVNGDTDPETGKHYGIYLYFPNKPGGALTYVKNNTFHFKNFCLKVAK